LLFYEINMNPEHKVREQKVQEVKVREEKNEEQKLTCQDIYYEIDGSSIGRRLRGFQRIYNLRQIYAHPPEGCSKDNVFKLLFRIAFYEGLPERKEEHRIHETEFTYLENCVDVSRYLGFLPPHPPQQVRMSWGETSLYLDDSILMNPFEMAYRADQLTHSRQFANHYRTIQADPRFRFLETNRLPKEVENTYIYEYFLKNDISYIFMRQLVEAGYDLHTIRARILEQGQDIINRMWEQFRRRNDRRDITIPEIRPVPNFWPWSPRTEEDKQRYEQERSQRYEEEIDRENQTREEEQIQARQAQIQARQARDQQIWEARQAQAQQVSEARQAQAQAQADLEFWQPVEGPSLRNRRDIFNLGRSNSTFGAFQFFLLDDVKRVWGNNPPFMCDNPVDAITQDEIIEPLADNRILIYFYPQQGIVECWDAYGLSAYCSMSLAAHNFPKHPLNKEDLTKSSLALLGFVHGILRESDEGLGVKQNYADEVFQKFRQQAISELQALEAKQEVEATFDNPTIAFKRMLCERKQWYENGKTPEGLCSAQPLKDFLDLQQYEAELLQKVTQTKAVIAARPPPPPRNPPARRTVDGADLPDPNENGGHFRRRN